MNKSLLLGIVILTLFSCEKDSSEDEPLNQEPDIMIYYSYEYHPWNYDSTENQFMEMLIGEELPPGERFYWAWKYDYSCMALNNYMGHLQSNHPGAESPYKFFAEGLGQAPYPDYIMFRNDQNIQNNDFLECTFPWEVVPWGTIKQPVSWFEENNFIVYPTN